MWQSSNHKRAIYNSRPRRSRSRRPIHLKRVSAEVRPIVRTADAPEPSQARILLNDISPIGLGLFCATPLVVGQEVAITLEEPKRVYLKGRIVSCQEHDADSPILSQEPFPYRLAIRFLFMNAEEEQVVRSFLEDLCRNYLYTDNAAA